MNNDIAMIMADCETPYAIIPPEMVGIDDEGVLFVDTLDKLLEVNTILKPQSIVVIPSLIENVDGLFLIKLNEEITEDHLKVIRMFAQPLLDQKHICDDILERIGATELASLHPTKV